MRTILFKMERPNLCKKGDILKIKESILPNSYYYTLEHAIGMSKNFPFDERILDREGEVLEIRETIRGFYIVMELE